MKISARLESVLLNRSFPYHHIINSYRKLYIQGTDVNTRLLRTINEEGIFIVPASILFEFTKANVNSNNIACNIISPISVSSPYSIKSADSLIINMLRHSMKKDAEIMKMVSEKYGTYYGTEGMILDSTFNILLLNACKCTIEEGKVHVKEVITYINPIVSLADTGVDKIIYTKILPTFLNKPVYHNIPTNELVVRDITCYIKPTVIFKDVTNTFLAKPVEPSETMNEDIYSILDGSIDDVLEAVIECQ